MSEEAKAVQEVAKTAGKAIKVSQDMGSFFNRIFGGLLENAVGLLADKLQFYRAEKTILLYVKLKERLQNKGITNIHPVLPKIGIPLIEQAAIEDNDDLHSRWANMLTNAMNAEYRSTIKRSYITILTDMEPLDVLILDELAKDYLQRNEEQKAQLHFPKEKIAHHLKITSEECEISLRNLMRLGCLRPHVINVKAAPGGGIGILGPGVSLYRDTEEVVLTALGLDFYHAVN